MNKLIRMWLISLLIIYMTSCSSNSKPCEDILEVKRQEQQCEQWRKLMDNNKYPQQALTAQKNYQEFCLDFRYYRDNYDTICKGNENPIGEKKPQKTIIQSRYLTLIIPNQDPLQLFHRFT